MPRKNWSFEVALSFPALSERFVLACYTHVIQSPSTYDRTSISLHHKHDFKRSYFTFFEVFYRPHWNASRPGAYKRYVKANVPMIFPIVCAIFQVSFHFQKHWNRKNTALKLSQRSSKSWGKKVIVTKITTTQNMWIRKVECY